MYRITKQFHFSAAHCLTGLPADHPCARPHGHNYIVEVELSAAELDENGFVLDYRALEPLKAHIDDALDHRDLNEVFGHGAVTAEYLARELFDWAHTRWSQVSAVRVSETPRTWAGYRP